MSTRNWILGVVLATLATYAWGFLYWGALPFPYSVWKHTANDDDRAAQAALRMHFPGAGTYYVPGIYLDKATHDELHETGPIGFVHITDFNGRPVMNPGIMIQGFLLMLATTVLISLLLRQALPALPTYGARVRLVVTAGCAAVLMMTLGDHVWWQIPLEWQLYQAAYDIMAWVVGGLVLAAFIKPVSIAPA